MQAMAQEHEDMLSNPRRDEDSGDADEADLPIRVPAGAPRVGIARSISTCCFLHLFILCSLVVMCNFFFIMCRLARIQSSC